MAFHCKLKFQAISALQTVCHKASPIYGGDMATVISHGNGCGKGLHLHLLWLLCRLDGTHGCHHFSFDIAELEFDLGLHLQEYS